MAPDAWYVGIARLRVSEPEVECAQGELEPDNACYERDARSETHGNGGDSSSTSSALRIPSVCRTLRSPASGRFLVQRPLVRCIWLFGSAKYLHGRAYRNQRIPADNLRILARAGDSYAIVGKVPEGK